MDKAEYERRRAQLIEDAQYDIDEHLSAREPGDAENARRWLRYRLEELRREYEGR
ncbi:hypothetical protein [uncultured Parolsenella sp.]|uniref:hypothetical protein n=1 Tax=uncultured Parolsenella sp. TaxID=2083008 RepID=UPI0027D9588E|nr:hypothetical protein [uncultured Parolsenella sp.]